MLRLYLLKAYCDPCRADPDTRREILHAKAGIKKLSEAGIDIQAMEKKDWIFLINKLCPSAGICSYNNPYEGSEREKLDDFIREIIVSEIMVSIVLKARGNWN
jgi:hypothetical protein